MQPPRIRLAAITLPFIVSLFALPAGSTPERIEQVVSNDDRSVFIITAPEGPLRVVTRESEPPSLEVDGLPSEPTSFGWQLPSRTVWVALPPGATPSLQVRALEREPLGIEFPEGAALPIDLLSRSSVTLGQPSWMRNQRVVGVTWTPVVRDGNRAVWERAVRVEIGFSESGVVQSRMTEEIGWEGLYRDLVVNYETARMWRRPPRPRSRPTGDYFSTSQNGWLRIEVPHHGLYAITGADLQEAGFDLDAVEPAELALFTGRGTSLPEALSYDQLPSWLDEVAIRIEGTEDGQFDPQDRIVFRGLGPDGWFSDYGLPNSLYERYRTDQYSNANDYWLSWGDFEGPRRRWDSIEAVALPQDLETSGRHRVHYERNRFYDPRPWETSSLYSDVQNPDSLPFWEKWFWEEVASSFSNPRFAVPFRIENPDPSGEAALRLRVWGQTNNSNPAIFDHFMRLDLEGTVLDSAAWNDRAHVDLLADGLSLTKEDLEIGLLAPYVVDTVTSRSDRSWLAWFEIEYDRRLVFEEDSLAFRVAPGSVRRGFEVSGIGDTNAVVVLDVTDPFRTRRLLPQFEADGSLFTARLAVDPEPARTRQILLVDLERAERPSLFRDTPPDGGYLRERSEPIDYILITHADAMDAALRLGQWRSEHGPDGRGLRVAVIDQQDIFDEFSAGRIDPVAIRNFCNYAFDNWNGGDPADAPSFVCILGDAAYDFRNYQGQRGTLIVPTYENYFVPGLLLSVYSPQFGSDDFYVLFDGIQDPLLEMAMGRIPADSPGSAEECVDKVIGYESMQGEDDWKTRFTLIADDICQGLSLDYPLLFTHMRQTEELADDVLPEELFRDRIYLYEFGQDCVFDRKPSAVAALESSIEQGTLVLNYTGHGSEEQLADERVLETPNVAGMTNHDRLFFFLTASCSVGKFDFAGEGLGEALVRQPGGGAIAVFSATAIAFSGTNAQLNREFFRAVFPDRDVTRSQPLGRAAVVAKANMTRPGDVGSRRYPLLGEPGVRIPAPGLRIDLELEGEGEEGSAPDTIYRGAPIRIRGSVRDTDGILQDQFDGTIDLRLYDSEIYRAESEQFSRATYNLNGAPIFRGSTRVEAGLFEVRCHAPAALRTGERGDALLYAFARSGDDAEAIGGLESIFVPEVAPPTTNDQEGPVIDLDVDGDLDALSREACFIATLTDSSGINITQLVPSRSVLLRIEEGSRLIDLVDLAPQVWFPDDYRIGIAEFCLPSNLESGRRYRMTLEASDNRDHRSAVSVEFTVAGGGAEELEIGSLYNVPNPLDRDTTFFVELNQPAEVRIQIYTSSGKAIHEINRSTLTPAQAFEEGIYWDGLDGDGDRLANGVYFYKVRALHANGSQSSRVERLAVLR